jgi:hypothetical protein
MALPTSVPADGNLKVAFVPAIANQAAPVVAELTGASVIDLSCYLTADGFTPGGDEQVISDDRLCSTATFEQPGRFSDTLDVTYVHGDTTDNAAYETLSHLTTGFVVARWAKPYDTAFAAADVVDVYPITCGKQAKQPPEANSVLRCAQKLFVTGPVARDVAVAATAG